MTKYMIEIITNIVVLLACVMCIITLARQLKPRFKRKPKRLFYVKYASSVRLSPNYFTGIGDGQCLFSTVKSWAQKLTDAEYDRIKYLLPNDHTLELVTDKK